MESNQVKYVNSNLANAYNVIYNGSFARFLSNNFDYLYIPMVISRNSSYSGENFESSGYKD